MSMQINNIARLGGILAAAVGLTAAGVMADRAGAARPARSRSA